VRAIAAALALAACGADDASSDDGSRCAADGRKDDYAPGLTKPAGTLSVTVAAARPGPPTQGMNEITLAVTDGEGRAVADARVAVTPVMPDHGHASARAPVVTPVGDGTYVVRELWLPMPGLWQLAIEVEAAGLREKAAFQFCIDR